MSTVHDISKTLFEVWEKNNPKSPLIKMLEEMRRLDKNTSKSSQTVWDAVRACPDDRDVQYKACYTVLYVGDIKTMINEGVGEMVCTAARTFADDKGVQFAACKAMGQLFTSRDSTLEPHLVSIGACEMYCHAARILSDDWYAMEFVVLMIVRLLSSDNVEEIHNRLIKAGACEILCSTADAFPENQQIQEYVLNGFIFLAPYKNEDARARLVKAGARERVRAVARDFPGDTRIQDWIAGPTLTSLLMEAEGVRVFEPMHDAR
jgi:hypothetical protein